MTKIGQYVLVIIPTYNRAGTLPEAIESVLSQDYPHKKLVIVDDGSTDDTKMICSKYTKKYQGTVFYVYQKNLGCASARNRGLEFIDNTVGYVCFLDSDDRLLPNKLAREIELLMKNPDADFTYADCIICDEEKKSEELRKVAAANHGVFAIKHFLSNEAWSAAILYCAHIFKHLRFREDLKYNEDSEFLQRVAIECKGIYSPEPSCWVRIHAGSKSLHTIEILKAELQACIDVLKSYPTFYQSFAKIADRRVEQIRRTLFRELALARRWSEAAKITRGPLEKLVVALYLGSYYRIKSYLGSILRWLKLR